ncbi:toprim domain-containing protein [Amorphus sp. 3PC139-8]|uniref:toprim domain-containing protein n=1 Tax=Amorphus sp. 3PC139-8 TaxID=2735676 RepID=UPI00345DB98B
MFVEAFGKIAAWKAVLTGAGVSGSVIATFGHLNAFPETLFPLGIELRGSAPRVLEPARRWDERNSARVRAAARAAAEHGDEVVIATDVDDEGDVIALEVLTLLLEAGVQLGNVSRALPTSMTKEGIAKALAGRKRLAGQVGVLQRRALAGRVRAVTDRLIGHTFSRPGSGLSVGRVRSALLGTVAASEGYRPEVGEIVLRCRSATCGADFAARLPVWSGVAPPDALVALANAYQGGNIPGSVRLVSPLSAGVWDRFVGAQLHNTASALGAARRWFGVGLRAGAEALQRLYQTGAVSYPRTESSGIGAEGVKAVEQSARLAGVVGFDPDMLLQSAPVEAGAPHEGLYPLPSAEGARRMRKLRSDGEAQAQDADDALFAVVARRAIEAGCDRRRERGVWVGRDAPEAVRGALEEMEWFREPRFGVPWGQKRATGVRKWPVDSVLLDILDHEGLGRPALWHVHADAPAAERLVELDGWTLTLSAIGRESLQAAPLCFRDRRASQMIEEVSRNAAAIGGVEVRDREASTAGMSPELIGRGLTAILRNLPDDVREAMLAAAAADDAARAVMTPPAAADLVATGRTPDPEPAKDVEEDVEENDRRPNTEMGPSPF